MAKTADATAIDAKSDAQVAFDVLVQRAEVLKRENRIEALRAASRIAPTFRQWMAEYQDADGTLGVRCIKVEEATLRLAEQFVRYIEKAER